MKHRYIFFHGIAALSISILYACTYELPTVDNSNSATSTSSVVASSGMSSSSSGQGGAGGEGGLGTGTSSGPGVGGAGGLGATSSSGLGGAPTTFPSVHCGEQGECTTPLVCCTDQKNTHSCGTTADCMVNQELAIECDGPEDCPGAICCGRWNEGAYNYDGVYCALKCLMPFVAICHFDEPDPYCPETYNCFAEPILGPRYGYCGP